MTWQFWNSPQRWLKAIQHFGVLGKTATRRRFLQRERHKLMSRLGETALELLRAGSLEHRELRRALPLIEKIEALLQDQDYSLPHEPKKPKTKRARRRKSKAAEKA